MRTPRTILAAVVLFMGSTVGAALAAQPAPSTTRLVRVAFISPSHGVGLFLTASGSSPGHCVWYTRETRNGGASFGARGARLFDGRCGTGEPYSQLAFNSAGGLFAYGPGIAVSGDMGRTWSSPTMPGSVVGLATHGPTAWVLVTRCHVGQRTCRLTLLTSAKGGSSWGRPASQPPDRIIASPVGFAGELGMSTLLSMTPAGAPLLALPAPLRQTGEPTPPSAQVEQLTDSGWVATRAMCATGGYQVELSLASGGTEWLACADEPSAGAQVKSLATSVDGGRHWRTVAPPCIPGRCHDTMSIGGYLDGFFALTSSTAFYVGGRSSLAGTFDGGRKWRTWPQIGGQDTGTAQVTFVNQRVGWVLAQDLHHASTTLWRTVNGGRSWSRA